MQKVPRPDKSVPLLEADGKSVSQAWYDFFSYLQALNLPAFSSTVPTNNQVPIYNSTTGVYTPGAN